MANNQNRIFLGLAVVIIIIGLFVTISYNSLVASSQQVQSAWSQVQNTYQRRLDLIPNLVATVKGYAQYEQKTFIEVTKARSNAISAQQALGPSNALPNDPQKLQQLEQSQAALGSALSRLLVVVEKYPQLHASKNFLALQMELAGTENRIAVERRKFNESVQAYNQQIQVFPGMIVAKLFGFQKVSYFQADEKANHAPVVDFQ